MIGLDSWIFLEYYTSGPKRDKCEKLMFGEERKVISTIVLMEMLYKLTRKLGRIKAKEFARNIICSTSINLVNVNSDIAEKAANLRLKYYKNKVKELSYADCTHLATAILSKCEKFYSGDPDFKGIKEMPIEII